MREENRGPWWCPKCEKPKLERLIGAGAGILFKGSGFYQTDYRSDSYKQAAKDAEKKPSDAKKDAKDAKKSPKKDERKAS